MTITYLGRSFCADARHCATADCYRRFTEAHQAEALKLGLPVAWMSCRETCSTFTPTKVQP